MAWQPSSRAPHPRELLEPRPFSLPEPLLDPEERRVLDAVLADPDADGPRLAFADWCDRVGDPRGNLIRRQLARFREGEAPAEPLRLREGEAPAEPRVSGFPGFREGEAPAEPLSNAPARQEPRPPGNPARQEPRSPGNPARQEPCPPEELVRFHLDRFAPWGAKDLVFRRGFVEGMSLTGRSFISLGASLFRLTPLREVRLVAIAPFLGELAACPHLGKLRCLDLTGNRLDPAAVRMLLESPNLGETEVRFEGDAG